jgi:hypothetical protein
MVMMFMGGVVLVIDGILVLFLLWESYGAGVFVPAVGDLAILQAIFATSGDVSASVYLYISICKNK